MFQVQNSPSTSFTSWTRYSNIFSDFIEWFLTWNFNQDGVLFNSEGYTFDGSDIQSTNQFTDIPTPNVIWK